jgi:hypothetical protein
MQKSDIDRFDLKNLNHVEIKNSIRSKSLSLQLWKSWMVMSTWTCLRQVLTQNINISAQDSLGQACATFHVVQEASTRSGLHAGYMKFNIQYEKE